MISEHYDVKSWLSELRRKYDISKTTLNERNGSFTVLFSPRPRQTLLVGRFDKERGYGVVICRRNSNIPVKHDRRQPK